MILVGGGGGAEILATKKEGGPGVIAELWRWGP